METVSRETIERDRECRCLLLVPVCSPRGARPLDRSGKSRCCAGWVPGIAVAAVALWLPTPPSTTESSYCCSLFSMIKHYIMGWMDPPVV